MLRSLAVRAEAVEAKRWGRAAGIGLCSISHTWEGWRRMWIGRFERIKVGERGQEPRCIPFFVGRTDFFIVPELLVAFFKSALAILSPNGQIIMTVFEGDPYELWNVRDLVRHAGLKVNRSFRFEASAYPGYKHARTLGNIDGGGGWKGENRPARTYLFESKENEQLNTPGKGRRGPDDSDSDWFIIISIPCNHKPDLI